MSRGLRRIRYFDAERRRWLVFLTTNFNLPAFAIAVYVLVAIVTKRLQLPASLYAILQIVSVSLFEKTPLAHTLSPSRVTRLEADAGNQLHLFD